MRVICVSERYKDTGKGEGVMVDIRSRDRLVRVGVIDINVVKRIVM